MDRFLKVSTATIACSCFYAASGASAAETVTYTYDALGRLTHVQTAGGPAAGVQRTYEFDAADNRTSLQVTGAATSAMVNLTSPGSVTNVTAAGVVLKVSIAGTGAPEGMVTFTENGVFLGSAFISGGQGSILVEGFAQGAHTITVTYAGDQTHEPSSQTFVVQVRNLNWLPAVLELILSDPPPPPSP